MLDSDIPPEITSESPCVGHCSTVLGDDVCRACRRTFEEVIGWVEMGEDARRAVNWRIAVEKTTDRLRHL